VDAETVRREVRSDDGIRAADRIERRDFTPRVRVHRRWRRRADPRPGYLAYLGGTLLSEGSAHSIPLRPENKFLVDVDAIPADIAKRAKILYLNYPNNPTAARRRNNYLAHVVKWCKKHDVLLVWDNAYSELAFDGYVPPSIFEIDGARRRGARISFAVQDVQHDRMAVRLGRGQSGVRRTLAKVKSFH